MSTATSTACNKLLVSIPAKTKHALSKASGLSVDVLIHTAGNDFPFDVYVTLAVIRVDKHKVLPRFMLYSINSSICKNQFNVRLVGVGVPNLHLNMIKNVNVTLPPIANQKQIIDYLDKKCTEIDAVLADKQKQLDTLTEYKKSLIYEYVTGKKEVPADA